MSNYRLTIRVAGHTSGDPIDFADFARACEAVARALKNVDGIVSGRTGNTAFQLSDLHGGSAVVVIDAAKRPGSPIDYRRQVLSAFRRAVTDLNQGELSADLAGLDVEPFRELAHLLRNGIGSIKIGHVRLTPAFAETLEKVEVKGVTSHGSVTGVLQRVNVHDRNEISLYPPGASRQIACKFPNELIDDVRSGLNRTVTVTGELQYAIGEPFPKKCAVTSISVHPDASTLPTLYDVRELGSWGTDGLSAIDFVRAIRDE